MSSSYKDRKGKQLSERLRGFTYKIRGFTSDPESLTPNWTNSINILKELYSDSFCDLLYTDNPMLAMVPKSDSNGTKFNVPVIQPKSLKGRRKK